MTGDSVWIRVGKKDEWIQQGLQIRLPALSRRRQIAKTACLHFPPTLPVRYFTCHGKELNTLALSNTYGGSILVNFIRWILGRLVLAYDVLTRPKPVIRDAAAQAELDSKPRILRFTSSMLCPFCVKVRRELRRHALNIELRDARNDEEHKQALINGGGRFKVLCLQISSGSGEKTCLYESDDIIAYLKSELELA